MAVRKLGHKKWQIDYYPLGRKGKRVREVFEGAKADALILEAELRQMHSGGQIIKVNPKVIDVISHYFEWLKLHRAAKTYKDVKKSWELLSTVFGNVQFSRISPLHIIKFKKLRVGKPRATNKDLTYLQGIIRWASEQNPPLAKKLPFKIETVPYKAPLPRIPHPKEIKKFLANIKGNDAVRHKAIVLLMFECGLRWNEAAHVMWENIDWASGIVYLDVTKGSRPRNAILTKNVIELLASIKKQEGFVFENAQTGRPWTTLQRFFKEVSERAKIKRIKPHALRHAFATYTLRATGDLRTVQALLGHRQISTTERYTQVDDTAMKNAVSRMTDYTSQLISGKNS